MVEASPSCRLMVHEPAAGDWNMAVDEALLEAVGEGGDGVLRFYGWSAPTLSLGYFQRYDERAEHTASRACEMVRRISGGGAILHDAEITYSLVLPAASPWAVDAGRLYRGVHEALIAALARWGVPAALCPAVRAAARQPFLCFQRRAEGDVMVGETKIAGSAQRRRRGAVLQHGSLLMRASMDAPELPGIQETAQRHFENDAVREAWLAELEKRLNMKFNGGRLSRGESEQAQRFRQDKYAADAWTRRR